MRGVLVLFSLASLIAVSWSLPAVFIDALEGGPEDVKAKTKVAGLLGATDKTVSYSGYVTVDKANDANMFFWLFDSESANEDAPLIVWLQGGPGCSSLLGLILENGPYHLLNGELVSNANSWTKNFRVLYLDNPVGSGFSYVTKEAGYLDTEPEVANELYTTITTVISKFGLSKVPVYIMGESYAGKYVPAAAKKILDSNRDKNAKVKVNLIGIGIGNGMSDPITQTTTYADFALATSLIDENKAVDVREKQKKIGELITQKNFLNAWTEWDDLVDGILAYAGKPSSYDIRTYTQLDTKTPANFFRRPSVSSKLRVGSRVFSACNHVVYHHLKKDMMKSVSHLFPELLDNFKVMIYHGQFDFVVNALGVNKWISSLKWSKLDSFNKAERKIWKVGGVPSGLVKSFGNLSQVIILGAGHMTPMDQPKVTRACVKRFISGDGF